MRIDRAKIGFLARILRHRLAGQPRFCPYCHATAALELLGRKKVLLKVLRCRNCKLIFRYPVETEAENFTHYQHEYKASDAGVVPSDEQLSRYLREGFSGNLNFSGKIATLKALRARGRTLDFGCSWGYGVRQLCSAGYEARGFELSRPRATFAREKLGVKVISDYAALAAQPEGSFDVIFSNHVLEHLPNIGTVLRLLARLLDEEGLVFAVLPNFEGARARGGMFWRWIGEDHPIAPTAEFLARALHECGFSWSAFGSGPFDQDLHEAVRLRQFQRLNRDGDELLVLAAKGPSLN